MATDYYKILGVDKNASQEDIKKSFRKLAHQHHPDKEGGNADKFKEINEAYQVLGNEDKRKQYDQFGPAFSNNAGGGAGGFNYQDFARAQGGNPFGQGQGGFNFDFGDMEDLGDIFGSFFGGGGQRQTRHQTKGADLEVELTLDFEEAVFGVEKHIKLRKNVTCDVCNGNGAEPGSKIETCPTCKGSGYVSKMQQTFLGNIRSQSVCPQCQGEGKIYDKKCHKCHGAGVFSSEEEIKVKVPAGIDNGQSLRLSGKGEAQGKGTPGDLYVRIKVRPNKNFVRKGYNIYSKAQVLVSQAILGDKIQVETVDGPVSLKIPEGTQSHTEFKLKDKGIPHLEGRGRGDHLVEVIVHIPKNLSRQQRKLIEEAKI